MKILLDIDDTAMIYSEKDRAYHEHPKLKELLKNYDVFLYSGNPDVSDYFVKWGAKGYIPKGMDSIPSADILIDDMADEWKGFCDIKKCYKSIDSFFRAMKKLNRNSKG